MQPSSIVRSLCKYRKQILCETMFLNMEHKQFRCLLINLMHDFFLYSRFHSQKELKIFISTNQCLSSISHYTHLNLNLSFRNIVILLNFITSFQWYLKFLMRRILSKSYRLLEVSSLWDYFALTSIVSPVQNHGASSHPLYGSKVVSRHFGYPLAVYYWHWLWMLG